MADEKEFTEGLRDAIIGKSKICDVNGEEGKLIYAGYDIHDLAQHATFEEVVYLLWHIRLPNAGELAALNADLEANRALPDGALALIRQFPRTAGSMDDLRFRSCPCSMPTKATRPRKPTGAKPSAWSPGCPRWWPP